MNDQRLNVAQMAKEKERIVNRHIAKILSRLNPLNIPEIAETEIKRQMRFLGDDIFNIQTNGTGDTDDR